jgi:hypothetical protein
VPSLYELDPKKVEATLWSTQKLSVSYIWSEVQRSRASLVIGTFTIFLVVAFTAVLCNAIVKSKIIYFKVSENTVGENDLRLLPGFKFGNDPVDSSLLAGAGGANETSGANGISLLNQSFIDGALAGAEGMAGSSPRWILLAKVLNGEARELNASATVLAMDSAQEEVRCPFFSRLPSSLVHANDAPLNMLMNMPSNMLSMIPFKHTTLLAIAYGRRAPREHFQILDYPYRR